MPQNTEKIHWASRRHTYQEPGKRKAALGPTTCLGQWARLGFSADVTGRGVKEDLSLKPPGWAQRGWCWKRPGWSCASLYQPSSWRRPCGRLGTPPLPRRRDAWPLRELRTPSRGISQTGGCGEKHGQNLPVAWWSEKTWIGLNSLQFSLSVLMLMPWSYLVIKHLYIISLNYLPFYISQLHKPTSSSKSNKNWMSLIKRN